MKLTIEQANLSKVLTQVSSIIERKNTIPILSHVLLSADENGLTVRGTDLDLDIICHADASIEITGSTTVSAGMLSDIVKRLKKGNIVSIEEVENNIIIKSGRSNFTLATLPSSEFPEMATDEYENTATCDSELISDLFAKTRFSMSSEETRYYLQGVYLHNTGGDLVGVSTDGHRMAKYTSENGPIVSSVIVPAKTVNEVVKLLSSGGEVTVKTSDTKIQIKGEGFVLTSKVIDGTFPDYARVIPQGNDKEMSVSAKEFSAASNLVATVSDDRARIVKLSVDSGLCKLTVRGSTGEAVDEVEVDYDAEPFEAGFNSKYLADMMAQAEGGDVTMVFGGSMEPAIVLMSEVPEFLGIVMPMRT